MELKVIKQTVAVNEVVFDSSFELPVESDILLPDYCPDIMKVLKCTVTPVVTQSIVSGEKLTVDGYNNIHLNYLSETMQIRSYEQKQSFTRVFDIKNGYNNPVVDVDASVNYANCRAINQRRLDVRGAVTIRIRITADRKEEVVSDAEGCCVLTRKREVNAAEAIRSATRQFTVREELETGYQKEPVATIVRTRAEAVPTEFKAIPGKVIAKGEIYLTVLYQTGSGGFDSLNYTIPVSQIIDVDDADEDSECDVRFRVMSHDVVPKANSDGEVNMLEAEVAVMSTAKVHRKAEIMAVSDAYSTAFECHNKVKTLDMLILGGRVNREYSFKETMDAPEDITKIIDLWMQAQFDRIVSDENGPAITGRMIVSMFADDLSNTPSYFEKSIELWLPVENDAAGENMLADITMTVMNSSFVFTSDSKIEISATIKVTGLIYRIETNNIIVAIEIDDKNPKKTDSSAVLTLYFAQKGESVWEIAKRYNTSMQAIMDENSVEEEVLSTNVTLLIPHVM